MTGPIEYQLNKAKKPATNLATMVPICYYDLLDVFLKETSDKILFHSKYDHNIELLQSNKDHRQAVFYSMSKLQLELVKKFFKKHLKKVLSRLTELYVCHQFYWLESVKMVSDSALTIEN